MVKKKIWVNFQRIVEVFTQNIFNMLSGDNPSQAGDEPVPDAGD
jgi:hypothetical protein